MMRLLRPARSVVVPGNSLRSCNPLVFDRRLEYGARFHLTDGGALHFLPGCLVLRIYVAARGPQRFVALPQFPLRHQDVHQSLAQVNTNAVAGSQNRQSAPNGRFGRCVED
jgi:hypothetical protein